jgi:hypothetical protein
MEKILKEMAGMPWPQRLSLGVQVSAALWQAGRVEESGAVLDSVRDFEENTDDDLSLPWAVLLTGRMELQPFWLQQAGENHAWKVLRPLSSYASDEAVAAFWEGAESLRSRRLMMPLAMELAQKNRLSALQRCGDIALADRPGEQWQLNESVRYITTDVERTIARMSFGEGRDEEAIARLRQHLPDWREQLGNAANGPHVISQLRLVLQSPPDESCTADGWRNAASRLAEESSLAELWPFLKVAGQDVWKDDILDAEVILEHAIGKRELDLAGKFVGFLPAKIAKPLRKRLDRALAKVVNSANPAATFVSACVAALQSGESEEALAQAREGMAAAKQIKSSDARRDTLLRIAACLICAGAPDEGFKIIRRFTQNLEDGDEARERDLEVIEFCEGMNQVEVFIQRCASGEEGVEWGWPGSLMNLALERYKESAGFEKVMALCRSLPKEPVLEVMPDLMFGDMDHAVEYLELLRSLDPKAESPRMLVESIKGKPLQEGEKLARRLIADWRDSTDFWTMEGVKDLQAYLAKPQPVTGNAPEPWPAVTISSPGVRAILEG